MELYGYGPDCCGPDDSAYRSPDPEEALPLANAATDRVGPAADTPDLGAGRPQEPRSAPHPTSPTLQKRSAIRIDLRAGIVDLRSIPCARLYEVRDYRQVGEYSRVLEMADGGGWGWATNGPHGFIVVNRLMIGGAA